SRYRMYLSVFPAGVRRSAIFRRAIPPSLVFQRPFSDGLKTLPWTSTGNQLAAPSPLSLPILWLVRSPLVRMRSWVGTTPSRSSAVRGEIPPKGFLAKLYPKAPLPPTSLDLYSGRIFVASFLRPSQTTYSKLPPMKLRVDPDVLTN